MARQPADAGVQAAGLQLLRQLAGCPSCGLPQHPAVQRVLGDGGAVQAAAAAVAMLAAAAEAEGAAAAQQQQQGKGAPAPGSSSQQPTAAAIVAVVDGLQALRLLCLGDATNLAALVATGFVPGAVPATLATHPLSAGDQAALLVLLGEVAGHPAATPDQLRQAAALLLPAAEAATAAAAAGQAERDVARGAVWALAQLLRRALAAAAATAADDGGLAMAEDAPSTSVGAEGCGSSGEGALAGAELGTLMGRACAIALALLWQSQVGRLPGAPMLPSLLGGGCLLAYLLTCLPACRMPP